MYTGRKGNVAVCTAPPRHGEQGEGPPLLDCTRGGKEMWLFAQPRPGTASRGKGLPSWVLFI